VGFSSRKRILSDCGFEADHLDRLYRRHDASLIIPFHNAYV
jgi:hypothetical protein